MPLTWAISHADRLVAMKATESVTLKEMEEYLDDIVVNDAMPYRKLVDCTVMRPDLNDDEMMQLGARMRAYVATLEGGPMAFVVTRPDVLDYVRRYINLVMGATRPVKIFPTAGEARRWLDAPMDRGGRPHAATSMTPCTEAAEQTRPPLRVDVQQALRARSELAFAHLQRSIVADATVQQKWQAALQAGEMHCGRLGAAHLLGHALFAFKPFGEGERADLVYPDRLVGQGDEPFYVEGLILTEWRICREGDDPAQRFAEARAQCEQYGRGVLSAKELASCRYAVVVSTHHVPEPDDEVVGNVTYRHVNITVGSTPPSKVRSTR